jgi:magnesium transporter
MAARVRVLDVPADGAAVVHEGLAQATPPPEGALRWIDIEAQDAATMELLQQRFALHPLAVEDCLQFDQRPKLEEYADNLFIVFHALDCPNDQARDTIPRELHVFLGARHVITVHDVALPPLEAVWKRLAGDAALARKGADFVFYLLADAVVDSHFVHVDRISDSLEDVEEAVLNRAQRRDLELIFALKHTLVLLRKVLSPQRDVFGLLAKRGTGALVSERTALYFRDVYDHLVRIYESIDAARDLLGSALEAYLSMVSQRTNEIMKSLTLLSAVFLPLTFLTGFFGQNFEGLPYKRDQIMYAMMALCVLIPAGMYAWFRSRRWL